jgi:hypothetical protein
MLWLCPSPSLSPVLLQSGFLAMLALGGAGLWAANEYGYINLNQYTGNIPLPPLPVLVSGPWPAAISLSYPR